MSAPRHVLAAGQELVSTDGIRAVVTDPEVRVHVTDSRRRGLRAALLRCDCGTEFHAVISRIFSGRPWSCPGCRKRHGPPVSQTVEEGQRFGQPPTSTVIEAEIRLGITPGKPGGYRYARLLCTCGTKYLAMISHLYHGNSWLCPGCSRRRQHARRRKAGGTVRSDTNGSGFTVTLYVGYYRSRAEALDIAARVRPVLLPRAPRKA